MKEQLKSKVLAAVVGNIHSPKIGRAKFSSDHGTIQIRFCRRNEKSPAIYKYNINRNTLSADFELWICGTADHWYLMPMKFIREIYGDPETYQDWHHPGIKVVSVKTEKHSVMHGTGGNPRI